MAKSDHKRLSSKHKIDRRLGVNLWGRPKSPINMRDYAPGQHGQRRKKPTDFGIQLMAKQKLKGYYGNIGEKQFKKYYEAAVRRKGDTGANLVGLLECRLDAIIYRMKLAPTVFACRQLINHGHVNVNDKRCNIPSRMIKVGEVISLKEKAKTIPYVLQALETPERDVPDYIEIDHLKFTGGILRIPSLDEIPYPVQMETNLVIEYYSR
tara:strand:+ start:1924 stop:2550 length:627 start_codon:yes stop_codon:yes gene_type:complete